ncbi:MAG: ABC transporter permease [Proteobacteria bacterium]|nr:ABC transporter permease [Pseudomonadota bacterium]
MLTFLIRRFTSMIFVVALISVLGFILIELPPGSALDTKIAQMRQSGGEISQEQINALEDLYGLRDPIHVKYTKWITRAVTGDFGQSFTMDMPVAALIWSRLAFSIGLAVFALIISWGISIPLGVYSATHRHTIPDYVIQVLQFLGVAIPQFLFALVLLVFSASVLNQEVGTLFSREFQNAPWSVAKLLDFLSHVWIPVVARSKGLHETRVIWRHAVRNALHPLVMALGTTLPTLISGEVVISIVLNLPTTGPLYIRALIQKDMYLGVTFLLMLSLLLIIGNLLADLLLAWVDPRVRLDES